MGPIAKALFGKKALKNDSFPGSANYWEERYATGGNSGSGSYTNLAEFKAEVINNFVAENNIESVIELGCGDGNQLTLANYPSYIGLDISSTIIQACRVKFVNDSSKSFHVSSPSVIEATRGDLALSLDVLFHLIEQEVFDQYLRDLFGMARKHVIIYSSNFEKEQTFHEKDRKFTEWVEQNIEGWRLIEHIPNKYPFDKENPNHTSKADFFIYTRT